MSVYTNISNEEIRLFLMQYDLGEFVSLQGIAQGVTNSNYFLYTSTGRYVLTIFETLTHEELPFFLQLNRYLSQHGVACPSPIARKNGQLDASLLGKPACIVTYLKGTDTSWPTTLQCFNTGAMLADMHIAGQSFPLKMKNPRYNIWWKESYIQLLPLLNEEDALLLKTEILFLEQNLGDHLPSGIIHADLFKDNVLLDSEKVAGFIDFYYACYGNFMYDLAIAINDWARTSENILDTALKEAFISGYESNRPLSAEEKSYLPIAQRAGCIRFWVSRLLDFHFPQSGEITFIKDPNVFKNLLISLR